MPASRSLLTKIGPSDLITKFGPQNIAYVMLHPEEAYLVEVPTIGAIEKEMGIDVAVLWIEAHVTYLYGASSNKEKGVADGISFFSKAFAADVRRFKLTELMLFFARYKSGRYCNSFSTFDTQKIGNAFFEEFIPERNWELDRIARAKAQQDIEKRRFVPPPGYTSLSWYKELKKRAASGDAEAIKILRNE